MAKEIITYEIKFPIGNRFFLSISITSFERGNFLTFKDHYIGDEISP